jgi:hypothetical protein
MKTGPRVHPMRAVFLLFLATLTACGPKVHVKVPATPAVALGVSAVAVVARDRECRPVADAMLADLRSDARIDIDPRAQIKLMVSDCAIDIGWTVHQEVDGNGSAAIERERADIQGRGHALLSVDTPYGTVAQVIGSAREGHLGSWKSRGLNDMLRTRSTVQRRLTHSVATDLVQQLNAQPQEIARRIYPHANQGTAKQLTHLAVLAEQRGDLSEAISWAKQAHVTHPNERTAEYLAALQQRLYGQTSR